MDVVSVELEHSVNTAVTCLLQLRFEKVIAKSLVAYFFWNTV